ncbi:MAG: SET domain-containing protein [Candidatus Aenigmarchaeota archaeon]|nr:SET domain-containing protein [Candidatus Aenigmarchaeota archaeon]
MTDVFIGKGEMFGKGVFAARGFKKNEVVIRYNLKPLTRKEFQKLPELEKNSVHNHWGRLYLYPSPERYVNHSPDPNTVQDLTDGCDIALRAIKKGEAITTDAAKDDAP